MADTLAEAIDENAGGPKQTSADGVNVTQHGLADQIAADKYLTAKNARRDPREALLRFKIVAPGAV